jgi:hypothetical protein
MRAISLHITRGHHLVAISFFIIVISYLSSFMTQILIRVSITFDIENDCPERKKSDGQD